MPATGEKILLHLNLDVNQINASLIDVKKEIIDGKNKLGEYQKALKQAFDDKNATQIDLITEQIVLQEASLRNLNGTQKNLQKQVDLNTKANQAASGSYEQLLRNWELASIELKTLEGTLRQNENGTFDLTDAYIQQAKQVELSKDALDTFNLSVNDGRTNVGQYDKALAPLKSELKGIKEGQEALNRTMIGLNTAQSLATKLTGENSAATNVLTNGIEALSIIQGLGNIKMGLSSSFMAANIIQSKASTAATAIQTTATGALAGVQTFLQVQFGLSAVAARGFAIAIAATGIGAIVIAIGLAVSALIAFTAGQDDAADSMGEFNEKAKQQAAIADAIRDNFIGAGSAFDQLNQRSERAIELAQAKGANDKLIHDLKLDQVNQELAALQKLEDSGVILNANELNRRADLNNKLKVIDIDYYNSLKEKRKQEEQDYGEFLSREFDLFNQQQAIIKEALAFVATKDPLAELVNGIVAEQQKYEQMGNEIVEFDKQTADKRFQIQQELNSALNTIDSERVDFVGSLSSTLKGHFKESSLAYKTLFAFEKGAAIGQVVLRLQEQLAAIAATNAALGPAGIPIALAQSVGAKIRAATSIATILAQSLPAFAEGGLSGQRISSGDGIPIHRSNGDNMLATVRTGEVILNERQQSALGGANTFKSIGVPGFASGGFLDGGFASRSISDPVFNSFDSTDIVNAIQSQQFVVKVSDINYTQSKVARVADRANI